MKTMTRKERLEDIRNHPEKHKHSFEVLMDCCFVDGAIDSEIMDAHPALGRNGGQKCDVTSGPCSCGAWH
jgi:hypothetical protein